MIQSEKVIATVGLAIGAIFGVSGSIFVDPPVLQIALYEISSVALVSVAVFLAVKYLKENLDLLATGFFIFAIGEAIMTVGSPLGVVGGQPSFGAGMALYVPGLLCISLAKGFPAVVRFTGVAASIPFAIAASKIFLGREVLSTSPWPGAGYGLLRDHHCGLDMDHPEEVVKEMSTVEVAGIIPHAVI